MQPQRDELQQMRALAHEQRDIRQLMRHEHFLTDEVAPVVLTESPETKGSNLTDPTGFSVSDGVAGISLVFRPGTRRCVVVTLWDSVQQK